MKTIHIDASGSYDVIIGPGAINTLGDYVKANRYRRAAIISDSNVFPLYGETVTQELECCGIDCYHYVFPAGEGSKNGATYLKVLEFLAENHITRSDVLIALGGGVVGDLTGFAAATYLRGVAFIQMPTSLLAMVDSSVGGKTAIDLSMGKNLAGAFYQPKLVLCDTNTLNTLPEEFYRDGCGEIIKYAVLFDPELFGELSTKGLHFSREDVIARCVALKRNVVKEDEFDRGVRQKLNLGHTIGHGIEEASGYRVSHGIAVAIGMVVVANAAYTLKKCTQDIPQKITDIVTLFGLPATTAISPEEIYHAALSDKKRSGNYINLIIPKEIGNCTIEKMDVRDLLSFIKAGLTNGDYHKSL